MDEAGNPCSSSFAESRVMISRNVGRMVTSVCQQARMSSAKS